MEEYQNRVKACITQIKSEVKAQGINYQTLADRLNTSLLTIKRQLNGNDLSFTKLLSLCDAAGLDFSEIWCSIEQHKVKHHFFTQIQDHAFYNNPHLLGFFYEIYLNKKTPQQIQQEFKLTQASLHLYLRKLESLQLITVSQQNNIRFSIAGPIGFGPDSKVIKKEIAQSLDDLSRLYSSEKQFDTFLLAKPMKLSDDLRIKMHEELLEVISRYSELSERYFVQSEYPTFNLVTGDYLMKEAEFAIKIINVQGFK